MTYALLALAALAVLVACCVRVVGPDQRLVARRPGGRTRTAGSGLALVVPLLETWRLVDTHPRPGWAVVRGATRDGVVAHLQVDFSWRVTDVLTAPYDVHGQVLDAVEDLVRREIGARTVRGLPAVGEDPGWAPDSLVPGVRVERAVVTVAEVAVSQRLRRLVDAGRGPDAWT